MAAERLAPDAVLVSTNYTTLNLTDIDEDPDSPDGVFGTWDTNGNTICSVSFGTPSQAPTTGVDLQGFRVQIRKDASGGNDAVWALALFENGSQVGSDLATGTTTSTSGEVVEGLWDAVDLGTADGSLVECRLTQTAGATGQAANRRAVEVGAAEWNADVSAGTQTITPDPVVIPLVIPAPAVQPGAATISPDALAIPVVVPDPVITSPLTISPDPVAIPLVIPDPTVQPGAATLSPDPVAIPLVIPDPAVQPGAATLSPDALAIPLVLPDPVVSFGAEDQTFTPDPVVIPLVLPTPSVQPGAVTLLPDPVAIPLAFPAPTVQPGSVTLLPDPVAVPIVIPDPTVMPGAATISPDALVIPLAIPVPAIQPGAVTLTPTPLAIPLVLPDPVVTLINQVIISPDPVVLVLSFPAITISIGTRERIAETVELCRTATRVGSIDRTIAEAVEVTRSDDESVLR